MKSARSIAILVLLCSMAFCSGHLEALAQSSAPTFKDEIAGSWRLVSIINTRVDGTKYELFGPQAKGVVHFDRNGIYSFQIMRAVRPSFAAENRLEGSAEENKAAVQGMVSHFGTYGVDETNRVVQFHIEGSSYPNWEKTIQKRDFKLLGNRLMWSDPSAGPRSGDLQSDLIWKREP